MSYLLAIFSGLLLRLSFPKPGVWILAWVALVPLFFSLKDKKPLKALTLSYITGVVFFISTLFWLINVSIAGMVVLCLYLALYVAVFGFGFALFNAKLPFLERCFFFPSLWVALEYLRGNIFTGLPWALLGNGQAPNLLAIQGADITGVFGVSFIVVFFNYFIYQIIIERVKTRHLVICTLVLVFWFSYGLFRIFEDQKKSCFVKVAVVQGNIDQEIKWAPAFRDIIFKKYKLLTELVSMKELPGLVVWPETSYPDYLSLGIDDMQLKEFARDNGVAILAGSITLRSMCYFNSAVLFSQKGEILKTYDKIHLVPFGEFLPARKIFPFLENIVPIEDFTRGREYSVFSLPARYCPVFKFSSLICFEDIFGDLARRFILKGADVLINMTNDAWFGDSSSPYQHMQASVLRAVENRVVVVRAANTGISCFIDDRGKVYKEIKDRSGKPVFVTGYGSAWVYKTQRTGLYTKIGDVFALISILYAIIIFVWGLKARR
ncbi:MAG TPA: apolipoprotein N-acyltransferase [Candidatus Omnitrophota bacterium]|nr:apolipoprotein N-acyltransferase [Candidatus Omnitrophota bacterium]